jgi:hypothetical protein
MQCVSRDRENRILHFRAATPPVLPHPHKTEASGSGVNVEERTTSAGAMLPSADLSQILLRRGAG